MSDPTAPTVQGAASVTAAAPRLTIIEKLEQIGHAGLTDLEHAAAWLVGTVATAEASLNSLAASSPLVAAAMAAGKASALAHNVDLTAIEDGGEIVLKLANELAAGLSQPAPGAGAPVIAPAAPVAPVAPAA